METIRIEPARGPTDEVRALIDELDAVLAAAYSPEQRHGVGLDALFRSDMRFYVARIAGRPAGCGGVALFDGFAEVKRMYVRPAVRGRGVAQALLSRIEAETRAAGLSLLRLETGIRQPAAVRLYERAGFRPCAAFGAYAAMAPAAIATSLFYEKVLEPA